mmetsp:Transcript_14387/g.42308  ORF Transcript_14387/g.42308 Transcript_14387/m.42308 type:complete len:227 (-) Transcript_14387:1025-1705(-)
MRWLYSPHTSPWLSPGRHRRKLPCPSSRWTAPRVAPLSGQSFRASGQRTTTSSTSMAFHLARKHCILSRYIAPSRSASTNLGRGTRYPAAWPRSSCSAGRPWRRTRSSRRWRRSTTSCANRTTLATVAHVPWPSAARSVAPTSSIEPRRAHGASRRTPSGSSSHESSPNKIANARADPPRPTPRRATAQLPRQWPSRATLGFSTAPRLAGPSPLCKPGYPRTSRLL